MRLNEYIIEAGKSKKQELELQKQKLEDQKNATLHMLEATRNKIRMEARRNYERICKYIAEQVINGQSTSGIVFLYASDEVFREVVTQKKHVKGGGYYSAYTYPVAKKLAKMQYWELFKKELSSLLNEDNIQHEYIVAVTEYNSKTKKMEIKKVINYDAVFSFKLFQMLSNNTLVNPDPFTLEAALRYTYRK